MNLPIKIEQPETIVIVRAVPAFLIDAELLVVEFNGMVEAFWLN